VAYSDPRRLFRADGSLIPIVELDEDAACRSKSTCQSQASPSAPQQNSGRPIIVAMSAIQ